MNTCVQCGKKKAKRKFCNYLCYARFAAQSGAWGPKYGRPQAKGVAEKWKRYEALTRAEQERAK